MPFVISTAYLWFTKYNFILPAYYFPISMFRFMNTCLYSKTMEEQVSL